MSLFLLDAVHEIIFVKVPAAGAGMRCTEAVFRVPVWQTELHPLPKLPRARAQDPRLCCRPRRKGLCGCGHVKALEMDRWSAINYLAAPDGGYKGPR